MGDLVTSIKEKLKQLLQEEKDTPTLPEIGIRAMQIALDDSLAQKKLVQLIMRYPDIAARVIHLANSPLFGLSGRISSIERAVNLLGLAPVRSLVLSLSVIMAMGKKRKQVMTPIFRLVQDNSFACGIAARLIAETAGYPQPDEAFLTGLLYHIGYLFILTQAQDESHFNLIETHLKGPFTPDLEDREREAFGFSHAEFGSLIASHWFLPPHIVETIRYHHQALLSHSTNMTVRKLIYVIQGSILLNNIFDMGEENGDGAKLSEFLASHLGVPGGACDKILLNFNQRLSEESSLFKLPVNPRKSYLNILRESNQKLFEISLDYVKVLKEKKQLSEENKRVNEILEALFNHSPDVIVALDGHGKLLMINDSIESLIGVPAEEFRSGKQNILDYYPPGLAEKIMQTLRSDHHGPRGVMVDCEAFVLNHKGRKIPVSFSGILIEENGRIKMTIGFVRDIRKRKALELELMNSKRHLDLIFNAMSDGIRVIDESLTIEYENQKMRDLLGTGTEKKCYQAHFHAQDVREGACEDCPAFPIHKGKTFSREVEGRDGKTYLVSSTVLDMPGKKPSVVQVVKDITPLKEAEQLKIGQHKLRAVMELAGATAHELNQPLTTINMGLEIISRQYQNRRPIPQDVVKNTLESVEKMGAIIKKLSEITQYETRSYLETMKILDIDGSSKKS